MEREGVSLIVHYGDLVDRRKYINFVTLSRMKTVFFDVARERGIEVHCLVGNHDVYYKNTNKINAQTLLLKEYQNVKVFEECSEVLIAGVPVLYVPWITEDNYGKTIAKIETTSADICIGHLELAGYAMYPGLISEHGTAPVKLFRNTFDITISGHFHHKSDDGSVFYTGAPYEMIWADYNDIRGFHILDVPRKDLTFYQNPLRMFHYIVYDDSLEDFTSYDVEPYRNTYVKLLVRRRTKPKVFEAFLARLFAIEPADLIVLDETTQDDREAVERLSGKEFADVGTTGELIERYIEYAPVGASLSKETLTRFLLDLFIEASHERESEGEE